MGIDESLQTDLGNLYGDKIIFFIYLNKEMF
jgi:hypothetical protein